MTAPTYITSVGFTAPTLAEITTGLEDDQHSLIGPLLDVTVKSPIGQLNRIFADRIHRLGQVLGRAYVGFDPDQAIDRQLDGVSSITGTRRGGASASYFRGAHALSVEVDDNTTIEIGQEFTTEAGTPIVRATEKLDNVAAGTYLLEAEVAELGPIPVYANTITHAVSNVTGLISVTNPFHAALGRDEDTDARLRLRRQQELADLGSSTSAALQAAILRYTDVDGAKPILKCVVHVNRTEFYDGQIAGKSFRALVFDGIGAVVPDEDIAAIIWANMPLGIESQGSVEVPVTDENGDTQTVRFSRPAQIDMRIEIDVTKRGDQYLGDPAVAAAIAARFAARVTMGSSVIAEDYRGIAIVGVRGVVDVTRIQIGRVSGPLNANGANYQLGATQIGLLQTVDVTVTSTEA